MPHVQKAYEKKEKKIKKDAYPMKVCHMPTRHFKKKKNIAHVSRREIDHTKEFIHHKKIPTHLHILIRLYDSFLHGSYF